MPCVQQHYGAVGCLLQMHELRCYQRLFLMPA